MIAMYVAALAVFAAVGWSSGIKAMLIASVISAVHSVCSSYAIEAVEIIATPNAFAAFYFVMTVLAFAWLCIDEAFNLHASSVVAGALVLYLSSFTFLLATDHMSDVYYGAYTGVIIIINILMVVAGAIDGNNGSRIDIRDYLRKSNIINKGQH